MSIMSFTVGSLFDGSGGFLLASQLCGGVTKWASEIEPYPIAVSHLHFPNVKHLGDVSKVNGREIDPVDVITFGSPCQDMSIAGERAGINENTRSGLFLQAVRIIKEMREKTNGAYPTFAVWENVYGRFSSNNGGTSTESSPNWQVFPEQKFQYLNLTNGNSRGLLNTVGNELSALHGVLSTLNFRESPKDAVVSTLSRILEDSVPDKYCLSPRACQGILDRAKRKGKVLDDLLRMALEQRANQK